MSAGAAAAGAAAAGAIIQAVRASGVIVRMQPREFGALLKRQESPLIVHAIGRIWFVPNHLYLTSYKGLAFFTNSPNPLDLPQDAELIEAKSIWIPG